MNYSKIINNIIPDVVTITYYGNPVYGELAWFDRERTFVTLTNKTQSDISATIEVNGIRLAYTLFEGDNTIEITEFCKDSDIIYIDIEDSSAELTVARYGAVYYKNINIPTNPYSENNIYQLPPFKILSDITTIEDPSFSVELGVLGAFNAYGLNIPAEDVALQQYYTIDILGYIGEVIRCGVNWFTRVQAVPCGTVYKRVRWSGRLGGVKEAVWLVKDITDSVTETQDIQTMSNGYDVRKKYNEQITLYLDGLSAYDVYYYSDIIFSNSVGFDNRKVKVITSSVTYPNGGDTGSVEVVVELANYL